MAEDATGGSSLIIRAWRTSDGEINARVTHGIAGEHPALEITNAASESDVVAIVRNWLDRIRA
ncbi:MAG: hypothetical protein OEM39_00890 [Acidimicrobiia bacterium]|nr:hypothetical protein [Acidimicrobiia bacterium]